MECRLEPELIVRKHARLLIRIFSDFSRFTTLLTFFLFFFIKGGVDRVAQLEVINGQREVEGGTLAFLGGYADVPSELHDDHL